MNSNIGLKLSKRMDAIVDLCEPCETIIDVGTDHGKIAIEIANLGKSKHIIATDINEGPLLKCRDNVKKYLKVNDVIFETIICDGLKSIDKTFNSEIIITGMGYDLICKILENIEEYNCKYLIVSPHTKIAEMIKFLDKKNFSIAEEKTVYEDNKAYFILKCVPN